MDILQKFVLINGLSKRQNLLLRVDIAQDAPKNQNTIAKAIKIGNLNKKWAVL